jgi:energy-coupling factor transporter ATP-binding protein EcfA2
MMILLVGLPGSGRTTVAKRLANLLLPAQNVQAVDQQPNAKPTEQQPKSKPIALAPSSKRPAGDHNVALDDNRLEPREGDNSRSRFEWIRQGRLENYCLSYRDRRGAVTDSDWVFVEQVSRPGCLEDGRSHRPRPAILRHRGQ